MIPDTDPNSIVYLNGDYQRLADAKISVLDRGFIFGDGIYDVVPVYAGKPFRMAAHLARLQRNLKILRLETGFTTADWEALVTDMIKRSGLSNCVVYIQVSRGVAKRDHAFPLGVKPTIFCMVNPFTRPTAQQRDQGLSAVSEPTSVGSAATLNQPLCWPISWPVSKLLTAVSTKSSSFVMACLPKARLATSGW